MISILKNCSKIARLILMLGFTFQAVQASAGTAIVIDKVERSNAGIVIQGSTEILPIGTKFWATVTQFNGKKVGKAVVLSDEDVVITPNKRFIANLKRNNGINSYPPAEGTYQIAFYAIFNRAWQEVAVLKAAGVKLDDQGRAINAEPHSLPVSSDLVKEDIFGSRVRVLNTKKTAQIKNSNAAGTMDLATKKVIVEINDLNASNNPIRSFDATKLSVNEAIKKAGRIGGGRAMAVLCYGDFKDGLGHRYLASDLIFSDGRENREFKINDYATMMDVCMTQEASYSSRQRRK